MLTVTVSQLNRYVKAIIEENNTLQDLYIQAEISNFSYHKPSGHMYFSLKDEKASVRGVMFRSHAERLRFLPENGMQVLVRGSIGVFERDGVYQVYVTDLQPDGAGAMAVAVRQLRERLEKEGLFAEEHKKPLPRFPQTIGVITSETGAAIGDITQVLSRRYPLGTMVLYPAIVQGEKAVPSLIKGVQALDGTCDVIIIGRGGGSMEDLWAFQDEMLARTIFMAQTPIISAVGHEMDVTICDMVADHRAPTPSAAAELAVPSVQQLTEDLKSKATYLESKAKQMLQAHRNLLEGFKKSPALSRPTYGIERKQEALDFITKTLYNIVYWEQDNRKKKVTQVAAMLDSLSPFAVLARGYSAVFKDEKAVYSVKDLAIGQQILLQLNDGQAKATVDSIEEKELSYE